MLKFITIAGRTSFFYNQRALVEPHYHFDRTIKARFAKQTLRFKLVYISPLEPSLRIQML